MIPRGTISSWYGLELSRRALNQLENLEPQLAAWQASRSSHLANSKICIQQRFWATIWQHVVMCYGGTGQFCSTGDWSVGTWSRSRQIFWVLCVGYCNTIVKCFIFTFLLLNWLILALSVVHTELDVIWKYILSGKAELHLILHLWHNGSLGR